MGVLGETSTFISVQEHIVNVQRGSNQRLIVSDGSGDGATRGKLLGSTDRVGSIGIARQGGDSPQALINRADIKVDLNFVILYGITYTPTFVVFICSLIAIKLHKTFAGD